MIEAIKPAIGNPAKMRIAQSATINKIGGRFAWLAPLIFGDLYGFSSIGD